MLFGHLIQDHLRDDGLQHNTSTHIVCSDPMTTVQEEQLTCPKDPHCTHSPLLLSSELL